MAKSYSRLNRQDEVSLVTVTAVSWLEQPLALAIRSQQPKWGGRFR